ncbi:outer membrane protein assembly factor BamB family protein [Actinomadura fibrosa]|uniref:PQQ-binding-like beta-propeller repeat protein n=1 Tax=Actinomadura fibrosa TaxID=111802 RepID=A0ABW2XKF7_9ACTN|nr:PQQ-binding-like beta-propeller repeat protein [Actinomadura fibrosa]
MGPLLAEDPRRIGGYRVLGRLGAGGMGTVYLGRSAAGLPVAIKVIHAGRADEPSFRARFAREVTAARAVSGAFTAPVIDADPDAADPWLVTAYLPGLSLQEAVAQHGPLPVPAVFGLGASLAEALLSVHRAGVVHRDLKPANVMLAPDGPRLIDFGIAHAVGAAVVTRTGHMVGSPGYLPPEQATGGDTGPAGDVFSLGAVLAFAATGEGPFGRGPAEALIYRLVHDAPRLDAVPDPELRALIAACLAKQPEQRPGLDWLLPRFAARSPDVHVLQGTGWLPGPVAAEIAQAERAPAGSGPGRRRVLVAGAAAGTVAVLGGGAALTAWLTRPDDRKPKAAASVPATPVASATATAPPPKAKQVWKHDLGVDPYGGLAAGNGVLVASGDQGRLIALDARTGRERWRHRYGDRGEGAASWRTPVMAGRDLYVGWPETGGPLFAFDAATGRERWRSPVSDDARDPAAGAGRVFAGGRGTAFVAVDAATGAERWRRTLGDLITAAPSVDGRIVFVNTDDAVHALDAASGRPRWKHAMPKGPTGERAEGPVAANGLVYCPGASGELLALDAATGKKRWSFIGGTEVGRPAVSGGTVYVSDGSGNVNALDAATGAVRWRYPTGEDEIGRPALTAGVVCFTAGSQALGVDAASGRAVWRSALSTDVRALTAAGGLCYIGFQDGDVLALAVKGA